MKTNVFICIIQFRKENIHKFGLTKYISRKIKSAHTLTIDKASILLRDMTVDLSNTERGYEKVVDYKPTMSK